MKTLFMLLAMYEGKPTIPVATVCRDFFTHLTPDKFLRKVGSGEIRIPVIRMEASQKVARAVHVSDLAEYLDARREVAKRELG